MDDNLNFDKSELKRMISAIRCEIGHKQVDVDIEDVFFNQDTQVLIIIAPDRTAKSTIIGKGGWVVGRLKEELGVRSVHVESHLDLLNRKYQMELALQKLNEIKDEGKQPFKALENLYKFLEMRISRPFELNSLLKEINIEKNRYLQN